jgi:phospholipid transport system transporter-binding protein
MSEAKDVILEGPVTLSTVPVIASRVLAQLASGARRIDFSRVTDVDSSAIALALECQRNAAQLGVRISIANLPDALRNLANLYGVTELIDGPV